MIPLARHFTQENEPHRRELLSLEGFTLAGRTKNAFRIPLPFSSLTEWIEKFAWVLFWICLPITSFRFFPGGLGGGTLVRPLSVYPMLILLVIGVIPRLWTRPIPKTVMTLFPFGGSLLASALVSTQLGIDPALGISVGDRVLRALVTFGIGLAFYLTVVLMIDSPERLKSALRWMIVGFSLAFLWGSLQVVYILRFQPAYFSFLNRLQLIFSIRKLFPTRISGPTYEPNWFAEQICMLLLPWLIAAVITDRSFFRWRWRRLTVESLLCLWAVLLVGFTYSRAGYLNIALLGVAAVFLLRSQSASNTSRSPRRRWMRRLLDVLVLMAVFSGGVYVVGQKNAFFSRLWGYWFEVKNTSLDDYLQYLGFGARLAYVSAAVHTFEAYPITGVGPGNYGFFFVQMLPDQPLAPTPELLRITSPEEGRNRLITPKNLYLRILAETGLLGMAAFLAFLVAVLGCGLFLWFSSDPQEHFWGCASLLGMIVFLTAALSFDSFTLPNMWVMFGLTTAAGAQGWKKAATNR
jgi:O-antigen ligase